MTGTDKQITWATQIKARYIADVRAMQQDSAAAAAKAGQGEQWATIMADVVEQAEAAMDAAWWIDNRQHTSVGGRGKLFATMYQAAMQKVSA